MSSDLKNKMNFNSKADTLHSLENILQKGKILPQICFSAKNFETKIHSVVEEISERGWDKISLIVRSSGASEDSQNESLAGHFSSVPDVNGPNELKKAVQKVAQSFKDVKEQDQIFIQPMLQNVTMSGVAFSSDPNLGSEYIIINYDEESGSTSSVTSGTSNNLKTFYLWKYYAVPEGKLGKIAELVLELENIFSCTSIDIEFAFETDTLYLLQVRKLVILRKNIVSSAYLTKVLHRIEEKFNNLCSPHPYLYGKRTVFGVMPDWNPAEIIGVRPRTLALSLYKEIVTDNIWAYQRDNYGYRNLRSFPLLVHFFGLPYIDVRVSFNSFLPRGLSPELSEKLTDYYIARLIDIPSFHDKVEFEIIFSCYTFDLPERIGVLHDSGFSYDETDIIIANLRTLTNGIINGKTGLWKRDIEKIHLLEKKRETILSSDLDEVSKIYWLIEDCKRYGTLPFAGLARAGFIAVQILQSLVSKRILDKEDYENFINSLETVNSQMSNDLEYLSRKSFLQKYGHLRPGTYDVMSDRYDEDPDKYFEWNKNQRTSGYERRRFTLSLEQMKSIEKTLEEHGLEHNVIGLFDFIKAAIEGREYSKFVFTRSLSEAISLFQTFGAKAGFSRDDVSFLDYSVIHKLYSGTHFENELLERTVSENRESYNITCSLQLPPLITSASDIYSFHYPRTEPNFITLKSVTAEILNFEKNSKELEDRIIMIPSADPGYDWIFSRGISGFITMYGGVNSHMAIRAGELGLPAVIGAGEVLYNRWSQASVLMIDCAARQVHILK